MLVFPSTGNVPLRVNVTISIALVKLYRDIGSPHPEKPRRLNELSAVE